MKQETTSTSRSGTSKMDSTTMPSDGVSVTLNRCLSEVWSDSCRFTLRWCWSLRSSSSSQGSRNEWTGLSRTGRTSRAEISPTSRVGFAYRVQDEMLTSLERGKGDRKLLALASKERLVKILEKMLDEKEFLSEFGIRSSVAASTREP